jgi:hypothetical protein
MGVFLLGLRMHDATVYRLMGTEILVEMGVVDSWYARF